ncbi:MAG: hypothetical protein UU11_C0004G0034 [Parcubacteria group bacterium GW2011_GWF2_40_69]|nr:MAG: hypothetical protein UT25_C0001G0034 [Parcubacteria group bacterium GW2011_GWC1_39_12]KKR19558.1 MAG: hypothetical protein UT49_C0001G0034 [Parcubacteria group bacterium GW2011_GWF1_39_37]KKR35711.1 MAG: hypothetical protein UT68_C0001G0034 [Parcubacteria group bacterium GW2011_GWC2_40_10]KKR52526.1 MAG: hypothetical protein UT89_C0001G0034 [Parcubacteria group bacterium GW2011_GWE1_40_20]KKR64807.1 MAG: hypothetical protein UU06_C0039G0001 [Parcubacteria group bacterium GW2011_GWB1_40_
MKYRIIMNTWCRFVYSEKKWLEEGFLPYSDTRCRAHWETVDYEGYESETVHVDVEATSHNHARHIAQVELEQCQNKIKGKHDRVLESGVIITEILQIKKYSRPLLCPATLCVATPSCRCELMDVNPRTLKISLIKFLDEE